MMNVYTLFILLFCGLFVKSQEASCYYDNDWKVTTKDNAKYYRIIIPQKDSLYHIQDFYISGELQFSGYSRENTCDTEKFVGQASWYYKSGFKNQTYVYDENSNMIAGNEFDINFLKDAVPFRKGNKWGFADKMNAKILIEPKYDSVSNFYFNEKLFHNNHKTGLLYYGYLKNDSREIFKGELIPSNFDFIYRYFDGYSVHQNKKQGYYDLEGKVILEPKYKQIRCKEYINDNKDKDGYYYFIKTYGDKEFSDGVYDIRLRKFVIDQSYKIVDINSEFENKINSKFKNKFYDFILLNTKNEMFALDQQFKLVNIAPLKFDIKKDEEKSEIYSSPLGESYDISYDKLQSSAIRYQSKSQKYRSEKGNSYVFTDVEIGKYTVIKSIKKEKFGLIFTDSKDFKNITLEPIYDDIKSIVNNNYNDKDVKNIFVLQNEEKEGLFYNNQIVLDAKYSKVNVEENIVVGEKDSKKEIVFINKDGSIIKMPPKKIDKIQYVYTANGNLEFYKIFLDQTFYYYINNLGVEFYEE